jgi:lactoylglutathione lyase
MTAWDIPTGSLLGATKAASLCSMARAIGINHVALEVDDIDEALAWYSRLLDFKLRGKRPTMAWIDLGDQFIALSAGRREGPDDDRHFGLVVDDKPAVRAALLDAGVDVAPSGGLRFHDPWGNLIEIVDYRDVQFTKAPEVLSALAPEGLEKSDAALTELARKGLGGGS